MTIGRLCLTAAIVLTVATAQHAAADSDVLIDDFTASNYSGWEATGEAFVSGPARGKELLNQLEIENVPDGGLACSETEGDEPQGRLTSQPFVIERDYIAFRIGGGNYEAHTCIDLRVDDKVVRRAVGWRSDRLIATSWDVRPWKGRTARLEIVDEASGDWGHILVDDIVQTDSPDQLPIPVAPLYTEALRPQFHITARQWTMNTINPGMREEGWINDLNGMIYYDGEYHVFAQRWNKCWLHFISRDLIHWRELEPAFWEPALDYAVQSGHSVIDYKNTSGLSDNPDTLPFVAFWSDGANRRQCISYSLDHGRTWRLYNKNPVLDFPERDPKVFWFEPARHWCMVLYGRGQYHFLVSDNLLEWEDTGNPIPNCFECPDFFELPIDDDPNHTKWVLIHGDGGYQLGTFDGRRFVPDSPERIQVDTGDFYATQTFENVDTGDGRRIQMAWMRPSYFPDMPFSQQLTFPCKLSLRSTADGPRLFREPIAEIEKLHKDEQKWSGQTLRTGESLPLVPAGRLFHIRSKLEIPSGSRAVLRIRGVDLVMRRNHVEIGPHSYATREPLTSVEILVDRTSIEVFLNGGERSITEFTLMHENGLTLRAEEGELALESLELYPLSSMWTH